MGWGAGTVINALATGTGCAFGISLKTECEIIINQNGENRFRDGVNESIISGILSFFPEIQNPEFKIKSSIPTGSGLGSSSAFVNSILIALNRILEKIRPDDIPKINSKLSRKYGISYTGAYDDACASFYGGLVLTDNEKNEIILRRNLTRECLILIPPIEKRKIDASILRKNSARIQEAVQSIMNGDIGCAMKINSQFYCEKLGYSYKPIEIALKYVDEAGLSGNGPAYICLGEREDMVKVAELWRRFGNVIECRTVNTGVLNFIERGKDIYDE